MQKLITLPRHCLRELGAPEAAGHPSVLWLLRRSHPSRQIFLKLGAGTGKPRHDGTRRNLRDLCYFLVEETFLVPQAFNAIKAALLTYSNQEESVARNQIEYPDEDPWIRQTFETELARRGLTSLMPEGAYQDPKYQWKPVEL